MKKFLSATLLLMVILSGCTYNYLCPPAESTNEAVTYDLNISTAAAADCTYYIALNHGTELVANNTVLYANCRTIDITVRVMLADTRMVSKEYHIVLEGNTHITFEYDYNTNSLTYTHAVFRG